MTKRTTILIFVLVALLSLGAVNEYRLHQMRSELESVAQSLKADFQKSDYEVAFTTTVAREYPVVGLPLGKVEVFTRPSGSTKPDHIYGVEYHYAREGGEWTLEESAGCSSEACRTRGRQAFASPLE